MEKSPSSETVSQLVNKIPAFDATRRFITVWTRTCHLSLPWARI